MWVLLNKDTIKERGCYLKTRKYCKIKRYKGDWNEDLPHGHGKEYIDNGDVYEGTFLKG